MFRFVRNPDPRKKPPYGSRIDPTHPLAQGLVGCWLMNEGGGNEIINLTIQSKCSFVGSVYWSLGGLRGNGGAVDLGSDFDFGPNPFTYCQWVFGTDDVDQFSLSSRTSYTAAGYEFLIGDTSTPGNWMMRLCGTTASESIAASGLNDSKWHFLVGTVNSGHAKFYVDDALIDSFNCDTSIPTTQNLYIFKRGTRYSYTYSNAVLIFNRELSEGEIFQLYTEPYSFILVPQYWYMVDFGAVGGGGETITISKGSMSITPQSLYLPEQYIVGDGSLVATGKNLYSNLAMLIESATTTLSGGNIKINERIHIEKASAVLTGLNVIIGGAVGIGKATLIAAGKTLKINEAIAITKGALSLVGKSIQIFQSTIIIISKTVSTLTGKAFKVNETIKIAVANCVAQGRNLYVNGEAIVRKLIKIIGSAFKKIVGG